eukprot:6189732-Pleurochrysis_carterae.AAC.1
MLLSPPILAMHVSPILRCQAQRVSALEHQLGLTRRRSKEELSRASAERASTDAAASDRLRRVRLFFPRHARTANSHNTLAQASVLVRSGDRGDLQQFVACCGLHTRMRGEDVDLHRNEARMGGDLMLGHKHTICGAASAMARSRAHAHEQVNTR